MPFLKLSILEKNLLNKSCWKLNFKWKNGIKLEDRCRETKVSDNFNIFHKNEKKNRFFCPIQTSNTIFPLRIQFPTILAEEVFF